MTNYTLSEIIDELTNKEVFTKSFVSSINHRKSFSIEKLLRRTEVNQSDIFLNTFEQLSNKRQNLWDNVSNDKLIAIIQKIETDFRLMNAGRLWKFRDDAYDEEWCVTDNELNSSISTQSLIITPREITVRSDDSFTNLSNIKE